ncbi:MAG: L-threonylcarbamoyladenylate synthase [Candidatus Hodarchaeales archaeon]|jgi:L-threonylcarbamoyladenylate synthase
MHNPQILALHDPRLPKIFKKVISRGRVAIIPTDTCYGLAANAFSEIAIKRVFIIKKRQFDNPVSVTMSPVQLPTCANLDILPLGIKSEDIPVPITLVLYPMTPFPSLVTREGKVGFRLGGHDDLNKLLASTGTVVTATSANTTNSLESYTLAEVLEQLSLNKIDLAIDGGTLDVDARVSAVVDLTEEPIHIIRDGKVVPKLLEIINRHRRRKME